MIRPAKVSDLNHLLDLIVETSKRTAYAAIDEVDRAYTRAMFMRAIRFNGGHGDGASLLLVSEKDGKLDGYFLGCNGRLYQVGTRYCAQEIHFYLAPGADERDVLRVLNAFIEWGQSNPRVAELRIGESNVLGEPDGRFAALLVRKGFKPSATVFTKGTSQ